MPGIVDTPHQVYIGRSAVRVGEQSDLEEAGRVDWVPLSTVVDLVAKGELLGSGSLVGLLYYLAKRDEQPKP